MKRCYSRRAFGPRQCTNSIIDEGTSGLLFGTFATIQLIPNDLRYDCDGGLYTFATPSTGGIIGVSQERGCYDIDLQLPGDDGGKIFVGIFLSLFRMIPKNVFIRYEFPQHGQRNVGA